MRRNRLIVVIPFFNKQPQPIPFEIGKIQAVNLALGLSVKLVELFDAIVIGGEFKKGQPDPEIFLLAATRLKLSSDEVVVFEDAMLGVEAARNGGMRCVGIARKGDKDILKKADIVVSDLSEVNYGELKGLFKA